MRLYSGISKEFLQDVRQNLITNKLNSAFEKYYGKKATLSEFNSWNNSLQFVANLIDENNLYDNVITLEFELPYSTMRIDCILFGKDVNGHDNVVVIELKQWTKVEDCDIENNVVTYYGGSQVMVPHPSFQVEGYHFFLKDFLEIFDKEEIDLNSCVYCHNYSKSIDTTLFLPKFENILEKFPIYTKDDFNKFGSFLKERLQNGEGFEIFNRFSRSSIKPSKKLLEHTKQMIQGQKAFTLVEEQLTANNTILDRAKKCSKLKRKSVIIVKGGPGTGKSVIALNVLAELASRGQKVFHSTGSKSFTETLKKIVGSQASNLFMYFNNFSDKKVEDNSVDIILCDEAHRIRSNSNSRFTPSHMRSDMPQVDQLIRASKVSIFFIDDYQVVRPGEIGSTNLIKESAEKYNAELFEFELKTQFRCSGSDGFLNWIDNILDIRETANKILTKEEKMDFRIFNTPNELYNEIKKKNEEKSNSARLVAGFCWPWSDPNPDGTLVTDVVIEDFKISWEGKEKKKLAKGIPPWYRWAYDPNGVNQCGCIYTIQGFEFDYIGVIFGNDLIYDKDKREWIGKTENSYDPVVKRGKEQFLDHVKHIYRVLLTRGMKGCFVYFVDKETEKYFKSRMEKND